jgi:alkyl sulfatase BDS1-like metallo-beta-lactamase superfamily hydrolase
MASALTTTQLFDSLAIRIDGKRAWDTQRSIRWQFTDSDEVYRMELSNGVLIHHPTTRNDPADLTVTLSKAQLLAMLGGTGPDGVTFDGDAGVFTEIVGLTDEPDQRFNIIVP